MFKKSVVVLQWFFFFFSFSYLTISRYALESFKILRILNVFIRLKLISFFFLNTF